MASCVIGIGCSPAPRATPDSAPIVDARPCTGRHTCSADLQQILCDGDSDHVVEACAPGLACGSDATCVPACAAAAEHGLSIGCDYYAVAPDVLPIARNACFAAFVVNASNAAVAITVDRDGVILPIDRIARVPQGQGQSVQYVPLENGALQRDDVAIVFLAGLDCPVATMTNDAAKHGTGRGKAFHITTSAPVVAYDMYPYGGGALATSSATLLLPTTALGPSYVAVDAFRASNVVSDASPVLAIVGTQDDTTVTILPVAPIDAGDGVAASAQGVCCDLRTRPRRSPSVHATRGARGLHDNEHETDRCMGRRHVPLG